jgi:hypothetical protein
MNTDKTNPQITQITQIGTSHKEDQRRRIPGVLDSALSYLLTNLCHLRNLRITSYRGKRPRYSPDTRKAFTISASRKLPPNVFSLFSQKL